MVGQDETAYADSTFHSRIRGGYKRKQLYANRHDQFIRISSYIFIRIQIQLFTFTLLFLLVEYFRDCSRDITGPWASGQYSSLWSRNRLSRQTLRRGISPCLCTLHTFFTHTLYKHALHAFCTFTYKTN